MVRKFFHKKSKRMPARTRYKIEKRVRDHHKKLKKQAKKNPPQKKKKKDPGIPNSLPFKDKILQEAEERKQRAAELRQHQKEERQKLMAEKRQMSLTQVAEDAQRRVDQFEQKTTVIKELQTTGNLLSERSAKTYYREFRKVVEAADVVLEVLDARDPLGSRCPQVEETVLSSGLDKKLVLVINKIDLIPKNNLEKWLKYLRNELPVVAFKASTQNQRDNLSQSKVPVHKSSEGLRKSGLCLGADMLMTLLGNYCRNKGIKTSIRVGVVGFPNVGKSSIINSLKRSKACNVGATPGVTRTMQEIQLDKHILLLDSPGVVMATGSSDAAVALRNALRVETLEDPVKPVEAILQRVNRTQLLMYYRLRDFTSVHDFLCLLARRQGRLKKGGVPDTDMAARTLLNHWNTGRIKYFTEPPETHELPTHISSTIVKEMSQEFDVEALISDEAVVLRDLLPVTSMNAMSFASQGLTEGRDPDMDETMEETATQSSNDLLSEAVTVSMPASLAPSGRASPITTLEKSRGKKVKNKSQGSELDGNLQLNKERNLEFKKLKKRRKRNDKLAGKLSAELESAMNFDLGGSKTSERMDEDYDFKTDFM
jgi:nuclear GTP-binding protein